MPKNKLNTNEVLSRFRGVHGDKYKYDLSGFTGMKSKIKIYCSLCTLSFSQRASNHVSGYNCPHCKKREKTTEDNKFSKIETMLELFNFTFVFSDACVIHKHNIPDSVEQRSVENAEEATKFKDLILKALINTALSYDLKIGIRKKEVHVVVTNIQQGGASISRFWLTFKNVDYKTTSKIKNDLQEYVSKQNNFDSQLLFSLIPNQWVSLNNISVLRINKASDSCLAFSLPVITLILEFFGVHRTNKERVKYVKVSNKNSVRCLIKIKNFSELLQGVSARKDRSSYERYWKQFLNLMNPLLAISEGKGVEREFSYKKKGLISFVGNENKRDQPKSNFQISVDPFIIGMAMEEGINKVKNKEMTYGGIPSSLKSVLNPYKQLKRWHYVSLGWLLNQRKWNASQPRELLIKNAIRVWEIPHESKQQKRFAINKIKECLYYLFAYGYVLKYSVSPTKIFVHPNPYLVGRYRR